VTDTIGSPYLQVSYSQMQTSADQKYLKNKIAPNMYRFFIILLLNEYRMTTVYIEFILCWIL
jgi:hypothetical protein